MTIVIIIPTYNEKESIPSLIDKIESNIKNISNHDINILIVDDNSPDGTQEVVRQKMSVYKNIELITGLKQGLGIAYARGMKYAMKNMKADVVFEMDADGQHDPIYIKDFIKKIDEGNDYVLGSRYIPGGSIPADWGIHRKIISYLGSLAARIVLGMSDIKDFTGGYKATRVHGFLDQIDLDKFISKRYAYKIQLLYLTKKLNARTCEIPINFKSRNKDFSKSTIEDISESLKVIFKLRFTNYKDYLNA